MHVLATRPGGYAAGDGIVVDLAQTPADVVILSSADTDLKLLADALDALPADAPSVRLANLLALRTNASVDLYFEQVLEHAKLVVVVLIGGASYWPYGIERLVERARDGLVELVVVPGDDALDPELERLSTTSAKDCFRVFRYLREGGPENARALLAFLLARFFARGELPAEARPLPRVAIYHPQEPVCDLARWQRSWRSDAPVVALLFYRAHLQAGNLRAFDGMIEVLRERGLNPLPIAVASLKESVCRAAVETLLARAGAELVLNTTGFAIASFDGEGERAATLGLDRPVLQAILSGGNADDWRAQPNGLSASDLAMGVVLPEVDGRLITRAISFKGLARRSERAQVDVVEYQLDRERAAFVAELAARWIVLARTPRGERKVALVLSNYPARDGRLGNGVGLDTPASTVTMLAALRDAGYAVDQVPEDGRALMQALTSQVTNELELIDTRPARQSLSMADYRAFLATLPDELVQAVEQRWGAPECDPRVRAGRFVIAGMRCGSAFVGIQPARGYEIDVAASYHDPDLVPPHGYLAFYAWLRTAFGAHAIVHVGKHGTLEWLPGKSVALSSTCWPDAVFGPLPHLYPFIVNDPGEGTQAKRRAQAVIVDHLVPPLTRAESYGVLRDLERLVDEYYQALTLDAPRARFLSKQILQLARDTKLDRELGVAVADDERFLVKLDAYLCDLKESQIRDGLHIFGRSPQGAQRVDTLVALARLPQRRGKHADQGLLHALSRALLSPAVPANANSAANVNTTANTAANVNTTANVNVDVDVDGDGDGDDTPGDGNETPGDGNETPSVGNEPPALSNAPPTDRDRIPSQAPNYDPLTADPASPWLGPRPEPLASISDQPWRTCGDTRERLELLARAVLAGERSAPPACADVLARVEHQIAPALDACGARELEGLLAGLDGRFVPPGPSGAPSRGRLDVLPTGRNFFSVDVRAVPTPAAYQLGERAAARLIQRYVQDHGEYPRTIALSAWGTATMRTGGDDIAQALALLGVRPLWAAGSQRVVDTEILPVHALRRPRVDVVLRISGFFRDAFPELIKLFDAAVQAVAALDESAHDNPLRARVLREQSSLRAAGMAEQDAARRSRWRVFGSKPGAYGAGLQALIDRSAWQDRGDLAEAYLEWGGYAYGAREAGVPARAALETQLAHVDAVLQNQDNREHDVLDSDDYYQFQGGLSAAVERARGVRPALYHGDHANPEAPRIRTLREEIAKLVRSRVVNPKWIAGVRRHGYKGAAEMAATVDYLFGYDAATDVVEDYQYALLSDAYLLDPENGAFLRAHNPSALREMSERLLEAMQRGMWRDPGLYRDRIEDLLLDVEEA